jgi:class 3 adenylate cyclase
MISLVDHDQLRDAGLYDPTGPNARQELNLLRVVSARGGTIEEMREAHHAGKLERLAAELLFMRDRRRLTLAEAANLAGVDPVAIQAARRAAGLPHLESTQRSFTDADARVAAAVHAGAALLGRARALDLLRVVSAATARVADAAISTFVTTAGASALADDDELVRTNQLAADLQSELVAVMEALLRQHLVDLARPNIDGEQPDGFEIAHAAVGFVDVISSTALAEHLPLQDIGRAILDFESTATQIVTAHRGRIVKFVGDEVMFRAPSLEDACSAALALVDHYRNDPVLPGVRAGVADGPVLLRDGDCFGPVVNLAARTAKSAERSQMRVATHSGLPDLGPGLHAKPLPAAELQGISRPVALFAVSAGRATELRPCIPMPSVAAATRNHGYDVN